MRAKSMRARPMRAMLATLVLGGAALLAAPDGASAQAAKAFDYAPNVVDEPLPRAAAPYGARYIPGVGFRYVAPGGPVVYGYYRTARGYRSYRATRKARRCRTDWWWHRDRCWR